MVVKAFRDKCHPRVDKGFERCIYQGLKWCLSLTKVLIIQSEEELPAHYLSEYNNVNTRLLGPSQCSLSELVSCSTIHSISTTAELQDSLLLPLCLSPFSRAASHYLPVSCRLPPHSSAPPRALTSSHSASPPLLHPSTLLGLDEPL